MAIQKVSSGLENVRESNMAASSYGRKQVVTLNGNNASSLVPSLYELGLPSVSSTGHRLLLEFPAISLSQVTWLMEYYRSRSSLACRLAVIVFIFVVISPFLCDAETTQDRIKKICLHTYVQEEYVFCSRTFNEHIKSPDTDILGLTRITIERSLHNATSTHNLLLGLLKFKDAKGALKDALVTCESSYRTLIESFQLASSYFSQADYQKVIDAESSGPLAQDKCAWSLSGTPRSDSMDPLVESNREMRILVSMSLVTANYIVNP